MTNFPAPPLITPHQMNILRAATAMAWADGHLESGEIATMLDQFAVLFAKTESQQVALKAELAEYLGQNIPLEEVIPALTTESDRTLVLKLGYQVISSSRRTPEEPLINPDEAEAYQKLIGMLGFSAEQVTAIEAEIVPFSSEQNLITEMGANLHHLIT